jgi:hypothetical protein
MTDQHHPEDRKPLQECMERFKSIDTVLNGNGHVGIKTHIFSMRQQLGELSLQVRELEAQGRKVQRLIWIGFGTLFTANLFMKGNLGEILKVMFASL